jgi:hypothetical protein
MAEERPRCLVTGAFVVDPPLKTIVIAIHATPFLLPAVNRPQPARAPPVSDFGDQRTGATHILSLFVRRVANAAPGERRWCDAAD